MHEAAEVAYSWSHLNTLKLLYILNIPKIQDSKVIKAVNPICLYTHLHYQTKSV